MHFSNDCAALTVCHQLAVAAALGLRLFQARAALVFLVVILRTFFILVESRLRRLNITASANSRHLPVVEFAVFLRSVCQVAAAAIATAAGPGGVERVSAPDGFSSGLTSLITPCPGPARPGLWTGYHGSCRTRRHLHPQSRKSCRLMAESLTVTVMLKNINDELLLMLRTKCVRTAPERPARLGCCFIFFHQEYFGSGLRAAEDFWGIWR